MATRVVGKLENWGDADVGTGSNFMKLEEGDNKIRVLSSPFQFYIHWTKDQTGADRNVNCAVNGCPLCQRGEKASARWYLSAFDRKTNKPSILEIGPQILKGIVGLSKDEEWGDPKRYDINVKRQPKGSQPLYIVVPLPHKPLSEEDKEARKAFMESVDLVSMTVPPTPAEVREKVGLPQEKQASSVDNSFDDTADDDDFDFED